MIKGNLSNIPAKYLYIEGDSLFEFKFFGKTPRKKFIPKIVRFMREVNVCIVLTKTGRLTKNDLHNSPFTFSDIQIFKKEEIFKHFHKNKYLILAEDSNLERYPYIGLSINLSVEEILKAIGA